MTGENIAIVHTFLKDAAARIGGVAVIGEAEETAGSQLISESV